jgi:hypothetical protein
MPRPCDTCRFCPSSYPSKGITGDEVERSPDFGWAGTCLREHPVGILWEWETEHFVNSTSMVRTRLTRGIGLLDSRISVQDGTLFPNRPGFRIRVDQEFMWVTGLEGNTWRVTRGVGGTTAEYHVTGELVIGTKVAVIRLYRSDTIGSNCLDWAEPVRVSRYERKWVI